MTSDLMPRGAEHVRSTRFLDGLLLHDARRHQVHVLSPTGALVWQACDGESRRREVAEAFADALGHPVQEVASDIDAHLAQLATLELLVLPGASDLAGLAPTAPSAGRPVADRPAAAPAVEQSGGPFVCRPIQVLDRRVLVRTSSVEAAAVVEALFADVLVPEAEILASRGREVDGLALVGGPAGWRLHGRGFDLIVPTLLEALDALVSQVNRVATEAGVLALHAAAVRSPGGEVVLLAGPSGAGKSTLAAALIRDGWDYLGDEAIGITPDHHAIGYPKPLSLDLGSCELLGLDPGRRHGAVVLPRMLSGGRTEGCIAGDAGPVTAVVLVDPTPGVRPMRPCPPPEAVTLLAPHAINLPAAAQDGLVALAALATQVPVHRLSRRPLAEAASVVAALDRQH
jgi:hypothetical protein